MIAEGTFLGGMGYRTHKTAPIRTSLDAKPAADAVVRIDQYDAIRRVKRGSNRAGLHARRVLAQIAKFWNKKGLQNLFPGDQRGRETARTSVGGVHDRFTS